jgi:predicted DCC family thiol-disulfide oxidoreductase YuxK
MTKTDVLYNGDCPVCSFEIGHYAKIAERDGLPMTFQPLKDNAADWGMDPDVAARRLYVRRDGQVYGGMDAFILLWQDLPRYGWLAKLCSLPVIRPTTVFLYDRIAAPLIYAWHKRRQTKAVTQGNN